MSVAKNQETALLTGNRSRPRGLGTRQIRWATRIFTVLIAATLLFLTGPSYAQLSPQAQFAKGQELFEAHKYDEALPYFRNAFDKTTSPNASLYVARCLEKLGKLDEAYKEMQITVTIATKEAAADDKYAVTRDAAAGELAQLKPRIALLVIAFTEDYPGATVTVNDRELVADELGIPLAVMPGAVTIVGAAPGRETVTKNEDVGGGETKTIALALQIEKKDDGLGDKSDGDGFVVTPMRAAGFAIAGLGVVGIVVFAIAGSGASSKFSQVEDECGGVRCTDAKYGDVIDSGKTLSTVANVSAVVGGAALAVGLLLIILGSPDDDGETPAELEARLAPSPGGVGVVVSF